MKRKRYTQEQRDALVAKVKQARATGRPVVEALKLAGISYETYYRWTRRGKSAQKQKTKTTRPYKRSPLSLIEIPLQAQQEERINIITGPTEQVIRALTLMNQLERRT